MEADTGPQPKVWITNQVDKEARSDVLPRSERIGQIVAIVCGILVLLFIVVHQTTPTGFFTDDGTAAAVTLVMVLFAFPSIVVRFLTGRKNVARPFEIISFFPFLAGQLYLIAEFPFDFSHFADPMPESLEFLLDWVSPGFARIVLWLGVIGSAVFSVYTIQLYRAVKKRLSELKASADKPAAE